MAGQPAAVGAPPRVLLYVGEPRRLAPPAPPPDPTPANHPPDLYATLKADKVHERTNSAPRDCSDPEFGGAETFRIALEAGEIATYQTQCPAPVLDDIMPPMQSVALRQAPTLDNFSEGTCDSEVGKGYVNYQFLEQSQSVVNILNQQVCEEEARGAQLVRTAEGVLLAVLPEPPIVPLAARTVTVPLGWKRVISGNTVVYFSPSGTPLNSLPQLKDYLQTEGTCKCGLPCPLRPETAFSFDPKVASKPYQAASGAELTKLCNHKRKLLATLQARAQEVISPAVVADQNKVAVAEVGVLKKKMKKRTGFPANMSPQLMQRDRPITEMKLQEPELKRTISPGIAFRPNQCVPAFAPVQHMPNVLQDDGKEGHVQKGSHYLTVSSGWITQHDNPEGHKPSHPNTPVFGNNGQIIGVNTGYKQTVKNSTSVYTHNVVEQETKEQKNSQQNMQSKKEEESQIFCGLNQPLTPEVMQKINEQQQIFIQQNQKQIEMAMKGFRTQMAENTNQGKPGQFLPQGQLVIQNGTVVKASPGKTPPWQVKRNDSSSSMTSPSPKPQKHDSLDFEDSNTNMSEDSSSSYSSYQSNEQNNQAMCSRVPPLPQQYNMMNQQWPAVDVNKKKARTNNKGRKKASPDNKIIPFGNNGIRHLDSKGNSCDNVPSFMDDPSGYLAQQTVLLNNTISRQVGIPSFDGNQYDSSNSSYGSQSQPDKSCKPMNKPCDVPNIYRHNMVPNASQSPNNTPDSSVLSEKHMETPRLQCCKGCNPSMKSNQDFLENQMRLKYMKPNVYKLELDGSNPGNCPRHFEDSPVTSSTFVDRSPMHDSCGPIQAGQVSTSNVSPPETLLPEPSPTLSNSSRNTDTPHSGGSSGSQYQANCQFPVPSPAYSNPGSCKDYFNSNPSTPGSNQTYPYNSPGPPNHITGTQMMHFISNHNVNKNLMEVDNIAMAVKNVKTNQEMYRPELRKRMENSMPGYCPPPHLGGGPAHSLVQACYVQSFVTTMASGFSVTRDTVTSVLAGKATTATTSINSSQANYVRLPPPPSVNLATSYAIPNNQPDPFINSVNLPTSYPLHIAGTTAQNMIARSPLEMVQNVVNNVPQKAETSNSPPTVNFSGRRTTLTTPGQILISSTGQIIVSNNQMPPPPPKTPNTSVMHISNVSNAATTVSQVPSGGVQSMVNQSTVVVNTLPTPFVLQPPMMAVDGQVVQQNQVIPQLMAGVVPGQSPNGSPRQADGKTGFMQGVAMLSPESLKKRGKKKKVQANMTNVLQISAPQQNTGNLMVHHSPQHNTSPQFSPRGFQLSPNNNISPTGMLQALTIVPGKSGSPAHIVMNGQGGPNNFGSQQIINTSPSQQINLLQPVNLINNASGVVPNFPFQQFIVPNIGGMMMTADGTIIQDNSNGMPMQLQLQTVNGQNVLTPVQNPGVFTGGNGGVVIRSQNQQGKILQSQHSPGAQFLSPNSQVVMNSPNFNGQLSPLLANLSPTSVTFNASSQQVRSGNLQAQEFIHTNQMGQTLMVPISPKQVSLASVTNTRSNSTFVQQNTTIVQQQTTLVANSHTPSAVPNNNQGGNPNRLSIDPNMLLAKQVSTQRRFLEIPESHRGEEKEDNSKTFSETEVDNAVKFMNEFALGHARHSVSTATQTLVNQRGGKSPGVSGSSPPDTTTHSPLGALEPCSPRVVPSRCLSTQAHYADTTTKSPEPADASSQAMVQCVSSSEQDLPEPELWPTPEYAPDAEHNMMQNIMLPPNRTPGSETADGHYSQNMSSNPMAGHMLPVSSNYYDRAHAYKRKNDFGDTAFRPEKMMRTNRMVHKESDFDPLGLRHQRNYQSSGPSSDVMQKVFDRRTLGPGDDPNTAPSNKEEKVTGKQQKFETGDLITTPPEPHEKPENPRKLEEKTPEKQRKFEVGDLIWGPVKGYASWPGKLERREEGGKWRVRWFGGDKAPGSVEDARLLTLSEGLEAHHAARTKHRKSRKLNTLLENAIQEAMSELDKKSDNCAHSDDAGASGSESGITETPKRKKEKAKKEKKSPVKLALKTGDVAKLRSSR